MDREKLIDIIKREIYRQLASSLTGSLNIASLVDAIIAAGEQGVYASIEMEGIEPCPAPCTYPEDDHDLNCPYKNSKPLLAHGTLITKGGETFLSMAGVEKRVTVTGLPAQLTAEDTNCDRLIVRVDNPGDGLVTLVDEPVEEEGNG